jgi:hypothetical protein
VSLDTYKQHKLVAVGFDKLYTEHKDKWDKMVSKSVESVRACLAEGEPVKAGDVVAATEHGIKISKEFEKHLQSKKLTQQYWAKWYAEYIVEQLYPHAEIKEASGVTNHVGEAIKATGKNVH